MKPPKVAIEEQAMTNDAVYINGGQRGLQVRLNPGDAAKLLNALVAPLVA
jgi:Cys-tRNA(Pro)/Cys-tRNA(Cys) deacylase